jgi:2-polyprenyl-3-methyl-5-hydroxy-6-metoxy-1,4-benzoquinol methylase
MGHAIFNDDVNENGGYRYTTNASFSSVVANKRISDAFLEIIPKDVHSLVDAGCGDGIYTDALRTVLSNVRVDGFDPAADAIEIARTRFPDIHFFVGDLLVPETLPVARYDLAVVRGVLHHLADQRQAIANVGLFADQMLIMEPNGNNPVLKLIEKFSPYHKAHQEQSFFSSTLRRWCDESGWKVDVLTYVGFVPFFCPTPLAKIIYFFQPFLERVPLVREILSAQIIILAHKRYD